MFSDPLKTIMESLFFVHGTVHIMIYVHQAAHKKGVALCRKAWSVLIRCSEVPHIDYAIH